MGKMIVLKIKAQDVEDALEQLGFKPTKENMRVAESHLRDWVLNEWSEEVCALAEGGSFDPETEVRS
jgi:hypothetical protein